MMNLLAYILAVAVAVLAAVCLGLCFTIGSKDDRLTRLADENHELRDCILEMELELERNSERIRTMSGRQRDNGGGDAKKE